jgi:hypothetical protein
METVTQTDMEVETQTETIYLTQGPTQVNYDIPGRLPTPSSASSTDPEPKETRSFVPVALPNPPDEEFSSDNGKFLSLFLVVIGIVALLATVFFMLHRYRALHKRITTSKGMASSSPSSSDRVMSHLPEEYLGGGELDRKRMSITLSNGDSDDGARARIVGASDGLQRTGVERRSWLAPVALVDNGGSTKSPRPLSLVELPPSVFKRESSPSPLRNMWQARSGVHAPMIRSPRIPVTQSMNNVGSHEHYDVRCRTCEKLWLARPLSGEWPKSP